jgi:FkbM family methyltransferase
MSVKVDDYRSRLRLNYRKALYRMGRVLPKPLQPTQCLIRLDDGKTFKLAAPFESSWGISHFLHGEHAGESETVKVFRHLIMGVDTFIDVGANVGTYTFLAKSYNPGVKIFCFEPVGRVYSLLVRSVKANGWTDVRAEQIAIADFDGPTTLYVPPGDLEASLNPSFRGQAIPQACLARTLDSICREAGVNKIELLKIDTESTEPGVLRGAKQLIGACKPDIICEVLKGRTEEELMDFLSPFGYSFYHLRTDGPALVERIAGDPTYQFLNYLFTCRSESEVKSLRF